MAKLGLNPYSIVIFDSKFAVVYHIHFHENYHASFCNSVLWVSTRTILHGKMHALTERRTL